MPNTKHTRKMVRKIKKRTQFNKWWKNNVKEAAKKLKLAVSGKDTNLPKIMSKYQKSIDKATKKGVLHKNKANRLKSNAAKLIKTR